MYADVSPLANVCLATTTAHSLCAEDLTDTPVLTEKEAESFFGMMS